MSRCDVSELFSVSPNARNHKQDERGGHDQPGDIARLENVRKAAQACQLTGAVTYLIEDIEILREGVSSGRHAAIVGDLDGVVEVVEVSACSFQRHDVPDVAKCRQSQRTKSDSIRK